MLSLIDTHIAVLLRDTYPDPAAGLLAIARHPRSAALLLGLHLLADLPAYVDIHTPELLQTLFEHAKPEIVAHTIKLLSKAYLVSAPMVVQLAHHADLTLLLHSLDQVATYSHELFRRFAWHITQHPNLSRLSTDLNRLLHQTTPALDAWEALFGDDRQWRVSLAQQKLANTPLLTPTLIERLRAHPAPHTCANLLLLLHRTRAANQHLCELALNHEFPTRAYHVLRHMELRNLSVTQLSASLLQHPLDEIRKRWILSLLTHNALDSDQWLALLDHPAPMLLPLIEQLVVLNRWRAECLTSLIAHSQIAILYQLVTLCASSALDVDFAQLLEHPDLGLLLHCVQIYQGAPLTLAQIDARLPDMDFLRSHQIGISARLLQLLVAAPEPTTLCIDLVRLTRQYRIHYRFIDTCAAWLRVSGTQHVESLFSELQRYRLISYANQMELFHLTKLERHALLDGLRLVDSHPHAAPMWPSLIMLHPAKVELLTALKWTQAQPAFFGDMNRAVHAALFTHHAPADLLSVARVLANLQILDFRTLMETSARTEVIVTYHLMTLLNPTLLLADVTSYHFTHAPLATTAQLRQLLTLDTAVQKKLRTFCGRLLREELLSPTIVASLLQHASLPLIAALTLLHHDGFLDATSFHQVVAYPDVLTLANALVLMPRTANNQAEWLALLTQHPQLREATLVLEFLHSRLRRVPHALTLRVLRHPNPLAVREVLMFLTRLRMLHQENVDQFILPLLAEHTWLTEANASAVFQQILQQFQAFQLNPLLWITRVLLSPQPLQRLHQLVAMEAPLQLQDPQSTHRQSVHHSTARAAQQLLERYQTALTAQSEPVVLATLLQLLRESYHSHLQVPAALRCLAMLQQHGASWQESLSNIRLLTLLAVIYLAITDDEYRLTAREDADLNLIGALYESQRGGNIDRQLDVPNAADQPICLSGMFNKFIEKMVSILPACEIISLSPTLASFRLKAVVKTAVVEHCEHAEDRASTIARLQTDGIEAIWETIRPRVSAQLFSEFAPLYQHRQDHPDFIALIDSGVWQDVPDLGAPKST